MAKIGYARVSTRGQDDDSQAGDMTAYGCDKIFTDTASGELAARPELDRALACPREGTADARSEQRLAAGGGSASAWRPPASSARLGFLPGTHGFNAGVSRVQRRPAITSGISKHPPRRDPAVGSVRVDRDELVADSE